MKGYTLRKNGRHMKNRRVTVVLDEQAVRMVMERKAVGREQAERILLYDVLVLPSDCCGVSITADGEIDLHGHGDKIEMIIKA